MISESVSGVGIRLVTVKGDEGSRELNSKMDLMLCPLNKISKKVILLNYKSEVNKLPCWKLNAPGPSIVPAAKLYPMAGLQVVTVELSAIRMDTLDMSTFWWIYLIGPWSL